MKHTSILSCLFMYLSMIVLACPSIIIGENYKELSEEDEQSFQKIEEEYCSAINDILAQAKEAIAVKEDIVSPEWLASKNKKEFRTVKNIISDSAIVSSFNPNTQIVVREQLQRCLSRTIRQEVDNVLVINGVSVDQIDDFFDLTEIMCGISQGIDCQGMLAALKQENSMILKQIAIKKKAETKIRAMIDRKAKKNQTNILREHIVLGAYSRK